MGSGGVRELRDWVEYCNFPGESSWAQTRAQNGSPEPFDVTYWGVGNENWGCGGNFTPEDYGTEFRRYASFMRGFGKKLFLIACGPAGNDVDWTNRFFRKLRKDYWSFENIHGFAAHYYCGTAGSATQYSTDEWYQLLDRALQMEPLVVQQRAAMDAYDPQRRIGLIVDEWGTWHPVEAGTNPAFLYQQNSLRDALVAATTLDIFNRHADKVVMSNIAQTVNVLQAMILTQGAQMLVTPTGYVYEMYAPHQGAAAVRSLIESDTISYQNGSKTGSLPAVAGSASLNGKTLFLTLTNSQAEQGVEVAVDLLGGARAAGAQCKILSGEIHAHNSFEQPEALTPQPLALDVSGASFTIPLPPAAVLSASIQLE